MRIPDKMPGLPAAAIIWTLGAVAWIAPEGNLTLDVILAVTGAALVVLWWVGRWFGGRVLPLPGWVAMASLAGLAWGVGAGGLVLVLMSLKTGLHAHGPEYSRTEIAWVWSQIPVWMGAGLLVGLGLGLLTAAHWLGRPPADGLTED